jgi:hypothetical protein
MLRLGLRPNNFTFPSALKAAASAPSWSPIGPQVHALALRFGYLPDDPFVACAALDMYFKTGRRALARRLFEEMPNRNVAAWNAVMTNSVLDGRPLETVAAYFGLRKAGGMLDVVPVRDVNGRRISCHLPSPPAKKWSSGDLQVPALIWWP